ncbi:hypothetical protein MRB53_039169 [Persea americana]|nr:hypothetical protein MRB53_039169 [Persea americana]
MVTRKVWIPSGGIYSVEKSNNASDPTEGIITFGKSKKRSEIESEKMRHQEELDAKRSTAGIKFDVPDEKVAKDSKTEPVSSEKEAVENPEITEGLQAFLESAALCNLATVREVDEDGTKRWKTTGDPTEIALQVFAHRFEHGKDMLEKDRGWKQIMEYPFDSSIKRMSVVYKSPAHSESIIFTKGAVERVIDLCTHLGHGQHQTEMTTEAKEEIMEQMNLLAEQGLRVLAIARRFTSEEIREHSSVERGDVEKDLALLGLAGLYDPPRLETKAAVQACTTAGITVSMLTGDHPSTAAAIAREDESGFSVFPLSPLQILWINMLTSSFPAFGLGKEKAAKDIMERPPHDNKKGIFTWELITDMLVYGTIMGCCCLATFVFIVFGPGPDGLGMDCNKTYGSSCDVVFRARASVFAELTWMILISAWESRACVGLNTSVFKHAGITWEWIPAIICVFIFVSGMELWKFVKRATGWFKDEETEGMGARRRVAGTSLSLRQGFFSFARTFSRSKSEARSEMSEKNARTRDLLKISVYLHAITSLFSCSSYREDRQPDAARRSTLRYVRTGCLLKRIDHLHNLAKLRSASSAGAPQDRSCPSTLGAISLRIGVLQHACEIRVSLMMNIFRNVKDFGATGNGLTDDTSAINRAISTGNRCAPGSCESSTTTPAIVWTSYGATNVFWRQIRNFIIDTTAVPAVNQTVGIHWPTGQATSITNVIFQLNEQEGTQHWGLFIEEGSGGFLSDLIFIGGLYGINVGNQQFTSRNFTFRNCVTAINQLWDWGWTYQGITIQNVSVGLNMSSGGPSAQSVGSVVLFDSDFKDVDTAIIHAHSGDSLPPGAGALVLENVNFENVNIAIQGPNGTDLAGSTGSFVVPAWAQGHGYFPSSTNFTQLSGYITPNLRSPALTSDGKYYTRSKPQYGDWPISEILTARSMGAVGDGNTDDTVALQSAIDAAAAQKKVLFIDGGDYIITSTIYVPAGSKIVGEVFPVLLATGPFWADIQNPLPVVQVGRPGEVGQVEWSDVIMSTRGPAPGAILIQWNLASANAPQYSTVPEGYTGPRFRIDNHRVSLVGYSQCFNPAHRDQQQMYSGSHQYPCYEVSAETCTWKTHGFGLLIMMLKILNFVKSPSTQGRGLLIESNYAVWLVGTAVEHHSLYEYQFANTQDIFAGHIQTETAYYQPNPPVCDTIPFDSFDVYIYGAGHYSFFHDYNVTCSQQGYGAECQSRIVSLEGSYQNVAIYGLSTVGSQSMVTWDGRDVVAAADNVAGFTNSIALFRPGAV